MIFVSTTCIKKRDSVEAVRQLAEAGFKAIELSGALYVTDQHISTLLRLKEEHDLAYRCHSYFYTQEKPFVLNIASLDDGIFNQTIEYYTRGIAISEQLGSDKYGVHAGFMIDLGVDELDNRFQKKPLFNKKQCLKRFSKGIQKLQALSKNVTVYVENNIVTRSNIELYDGEDPLLLTSSAGYKELNEYMPCALLLDVGHLNVSAHALGLDFAEELRNLLPYSDYLHISGNDGLRDQHQPLSLESFCIKELQSLDIANKDMTLELRACALNDVSRSYELTKGVHSNG